MGARIENGRMKKEQDSSEGRNEVSSSITTVVLARGTAARISSVVILSEVFYQHTRRSDSKDGITFVILPAEFDDSISQQHFSHVPHG